MKYSNQNEVEIRWCTLRKIGDDTLHRPSYESHELVCKGLCFSTLKTVMKGTKEL